MFRIPVALVNQWPAKLALAVVLAGLDGLLQKLGGIYGELFDGDPILVVLLVTLLVMDAVTGIMASLKRGERLRSKVLRQTGWKALEYTAIGMVGVMISNAFQHKPLIHVVTDGMDEASLFYVAAVEVFSIAENVTGSREGARRLIRQIRTIARGDDEVIVEEIIRPLPPAPADQAAIPPPAAPAPPAQS